METRCKVNKIGCTGKKRRRHAACEVCWEKFGNLDKAAREQDIFTGKSGSTPAINAGSLRRYRA